MAHAFQIESPGTALDRHFPHQAYLYQVSQIVVGGSPGRAWIHTIHGFEYFRSGGMSLMVGQE
jgi:hypothetical protein